MGRLYSRFWSNLSKNFNFGGPTPLAVKFGTEEGTQGPLLRAKFHPHRCNVSPLRGEKPQNRPLSKLNTGRFALRAMLPVITLPHRWYGGGWLPPSHSRDLVTPPQELHLYSQPCRPQAEALQALHVPCPCHHHFCL